MRRVVLFAVSVAGIALWLWLALDARLHWDAGYALYSAAYSSFADILDDSFQPVGLLSFNYHRLGHLLILRLCVAIFGSGLAGLWATIAIFLGMLGAVLWFCYRIIALLVPGGGKPWAAVGLTAFAPLPVYLAFKTTPEIPALLFATTAILALLRSLNGPRVLWLALTTLALAATGLTKNNIALAYASFVVTMVLFKGFGWPLNRLFWHAIISGAASLGIFASVLAGIGVSYDDYIDLIRYVSGEREPLSSLLLHVALESGVFYLALPLAFLSRMRREARFLAVWFLLATVPTPLIFESIEARYLASNLPALIGLVHLMIDGLGDRVRLLWHRSQIAVACVGVAAVAAAVSSNALGQRVMAHGVEIGKYDGIIERLDWYYGHDQYAILVPWTVDFYYLRFVYPGRPIYSVLVYSVSDGPQWTARCPDCLIKRLEPHLVLQGIDQARSLERELVYLGYEENFAVANVRMMVQLIPIPAVRASIERDVNQVIDTEHLKGSWVWQHPQVRLVKLAEEGHYQAFAVTFR